MHFSCCLMDITNRRYRYHGSLNDGAFKMSHLHKVMFRKEIVWNFFFPEGDFHVVLLIGEENKKHSISIIHLLTLQSSQAALWNFKWEITGAEAVGISSIGPTSLRFKNIGSLLFTGYPKGHIMFVQHKELKVLHHSSFCLRYFEYFPLTLCQEMHLIQSVAHEITDILFNTHTYLQHFFPTVFPSQTSLE